jgi:hypothetical protein
MKWAGQNAEPAFVVCAPLIPRTPLVMAAATPQNCQSLSPQRMNDQHCRYLLCGDSIGSRHPHHHDSPLRIVTICPDPHSELVIMGGRRWQAHNQSSTNMAGSQNLVKGKTMPFGLPEEEVDFSY